MPGTYFLPRLLVALAVPLVLASFGPAESHPELGTDMAPVKQKKGPEVYRAEDIRIQNALNEAHKTREVVKIQAYRHGREIKLRRKQD